MTLEGPSYAHMNSDQSLGVAVAVCGDVGLSGSDCHTAQTCFDCPAPAAAFVRLYFEVNTFPHLENVIASFTLSNDGTADLFSYESVAPNLLLGLETTTLSLALQRSRPLGWC